MEARAEVERALQAKYPHGGDHTSAGSQASKLSNGQLAPAKAPAGTMVGAALRRLDKEAKTDPVVAELRGRALQARYPHGGDRKSGEVQAIKLYNVQLAPPALMLRCPVAIGV